MVGKSRYGSLDLSISPPLLTSISSLADRKTKGLSTSSWLVTSFHEHLACFLVHPMQAVKFFKQSM